MPYPTAAHEPTDASVAPPDLTGPSRFGGGAWVRTPQLRTLDEDDHDRHATSLELFFDLVFVVAIAQLSHELVLDHGVGGFARLAGLFVPVYVAWQGFSMYADRFDTDDVLFRFAMFAAMLAIAAMAILIPDVWHGHRTAAFALSYVALRSIMLALFVRAYRAVPRARPLLRRYGIGYGGAVGLWVLSLAVPEPARYALWGIGLVVDLSLPPLSTRLHRAIPTGGRHVPERWGLFTLIALGESVVAVALGSSEAEFDRASSVAAALGFLVVAALWWLYFDGFEGVTLQGGSPTPVFYSYAHLPLLIGLGSVSAGISLLIEQAGEDHLETGAAVALLGGTALYVLALLVAHSLTLRAAWRAGLRHKGAAVAVLGAILLASRLLPPIATVAALLAVLIALGASQGIYVRSGKH